MAISNNSTGLRPGVCTSTTRPTAPYEGQMIYETDTDMVAIWNGTAWRYIAATTPTNGTVLQVQSTLKTDTFSYASATFADVTGLTVAITPKSTSSKVLVIASVTMMHITGQSEVYTRIARGGTGIAVGDASGSRPQVTSAINDLITTVPMFALDAPASTSSLTYSVQVRAAVGGLTGYVNRSYADTNGSSGIRSSSSITVMEIAA